METERQKKDGAEMKTQDKKPNKEKESTDHPPAAYVSLQGSIPEYPHAHAVLSCYRGR